MASLTDTSSTVGQQNALTEEFQVLCWHIEPALNQISHVDTGFQRHLEPRLMKLLCYLAANAGQVISRDELVAELWPRVVVNENSLTRAVSELRKCLSYEDCNAREFIRTIPKRGYRLSAGVSRSPASDPQVIQPDEVQSDEVGAAMAVRQPALWQRPVALGSAGAALSLCLTVLLALPGANQGQNQPLLANQITAPLQDEVVMESPLLGNAQVQLSSSWTADQPGVQAPVLGPDGQRFAYIKQDFTGSTIYLGEMSSEQEPVAIFNAPCELRNLTWSPLGNALLFSRAAQMTPAAIYSNQQPSQELFSLNLDSLQLKRLVEEDAPVNNELPKSNLTYRTISLFPTEPA